MKYILPQRVLTSFLSHAVNNFATEDSKKKHVESLALIFGKKNGDELSAIHIIYPKQHGTKDFVEDIGK